LLISACGFKEQFEILKDVLIKLSETNKLLTNKIEYLENMISKIDKK